MDIYDSFLKRLDLKRFFYIILTLKFIGATGQEVTISLDKQDIYLQDKLVVHIDFPIGFKKEFKIFHSYLFPEIPDLVKENTVFKESEKGYRISQFYRALEPGTYSIPPIGFKIRNTPIQFKGGIVRVKNGKQNPRAKIENLEYFESEPEAILELKTNKKLAFQGEGIGVQLSFLISEKNESEITLFQLTQQRQKALQILSGLHCTILDNPDLRISEDTFSLRGIRYHKFTYAELMMFPFDSTYLQIPAVPFEVITYQIARSEDGIERIPVVKRFFSVPQKIKLLPSSRLLPVGNWKQTESITSNKFKTGKSFSYTFMISGEGNIAALPAPTLVHNEILEIYPPKSYQQQVFLNGKVTGMKSFTYFITPKEPGNYSLRNFLYFPYFNTDLKRLDTLFPKIELKIKGESLKNTYISTNHPDDFYHSANVGSNTLEPIDKEDPLAIYANILILMMLITSAVIVLKK